MNFGSAHEESYSYNSNKECSVRLLKKHSWPWELPFRYLKSRKKAIVNSLKYKARDMTLHEFTKQEFCKGVYKNESVLFHLVKIHHTGLLWKLAMCRMFRKKRNWLVEEGISKNKNQKLLLHKFQRELPMFRFCFVSLFPKSKVSKRKTRAIKKLNLAWKFTYLLVYLFSECFLGKMWYHEKMKAVLWDKLT